MSSELEPPEKKPKITGNNDLCIETIDKCIENITSSEKNLQPIINDEFHMPIQLVKVYVGHIRSAKDISRTILILNERIPLKELSHLKRVRCQCIILCPTTFLHNMSSIQEYIEIHALELKDVFDYFKEINVPLLPPKIVSQYNETKKIWPCNFHPNTYFEKLVSDHFFSSYEVKLHRQFMGVVFEIAKWYVMHRGTSSVVGGIFENVNVTVVVNPINNRIVTISYDYRHNHPMQHSAMLAIDNVAKTQNGGVWSTDYDNNLLPGLEQELIDYLKEKFSHFGIGMKKSKTDVQEEKSVNDLHGEGCGAKTDLHGEDCGHKTVVHGETKEKDGPYLCTGYYIYMLREPCVMCAMGLVHARAKRIFYCFNNSDTGALNSVVKLQTVASLNHHFEVFSGFL
ncbi:probable inactive tRNA-specific adenosine deaminase-like protein 3 [Bicyclus anynana]|uniref:Probable inactive tRNA-specific adenosine deaminase-like protein 3 n=1 Tax=Bicyclus anynana TaxID=110368 RepID=A0A6J1MYU7_BICAN|nr:probable inactive tRNA-specific adenosine deaminase-like protein 3 [Bicyclus anynana]